MSVYNCIFQVPLGLPNWGNATTTLTSNTAWYPNADLYRIGSYQLTTDKREDKQRAMADSECRRKVLGNG